jgi:hypothetical protein
MVLRLLSVGPYSTVTLPDPNALAAVVFGTGAIHRRSVPKISVVWYSTWFWSGGIFKR